MLLIVLAIISAILYRIGGSDLHIPMKTKFRDWGVPACSVLAMVFVIRPDVSIWAHLLHFLILWGALTTYWDHWGSDGVEWYEWILTGFVYSLASLPYAWESGHWIAFAVHVAAQTGLFAAVRLLSKNVYVEEYGSGAGIILSKLAFLIEA